MKIRYTDDEYATLADAARLAGLTPTGYAAEAALAAAARLAGLTPTGYAAGAALAAAANAAPPSTAPWRLALAELMAARGQVRRFGNNVNQAARTLNALGEAPEWLARAVAVTERAVIRLDEAATTVVAVARAERTANGRGQVIAASREAEVPSQLAPAHRVAGRKDAREGHTTPDHRDSRPVESDLVEPVNRPAGDGAS